MAFRNWGPFTSYKWMFGVSSTNTPVLYCTEHPTNSKVQRHSVEGNSLQLDKKRPPFHETRRFSDVFRRHCEFSLSWPNYFSQQTLMLFLSDTIHGAFAKLRKVTITSVTYVCPSVRPFVLLYGTTRLSLDGFPRKLVFEFLNLSRKFKFH
jgi:hypothetical protein